MIYLKEVSKTLGINEKYISFDTVNNICVTIVSDGVNFNVIQTPSFKSSYQYFKYFPNDYHKITKEQFVDFFNRIVKRIELKAKI